jgi:hypothetical protein
VIRMFPLLGRILETLPQFHLFVTFDFETALEK